MVRRLVRLTRLSLHPNAPPSRGGYPRGRDGLRGAGEEGGRPPVVERLALLPDRGDQGGVAIRGDMHPGEGDGRDARAALLSRGVHRVQRRDEPVLSRRLPPKTVAVLPVQHRELAPRNYHGEATGARHPSSRGTRSRSVDNFDPPRAPSPSTRAPTHRPALSRRRTNAEINENNPPRSSFPGYTTVEYQMENKNPRPPCFLIVLDTAMSRGGAPGRQGLARATRRAPAGGVPVGLITFGATVTVHELCDGNAFQSPTS